MAKNIQAIRGMNDYLPGETAIWQRIEGTLKNVLGSYGYSEIRLPIVEQTPLFKRAIGEVTDVVEKEMYTFEDRNGDSLTLRPEGISVPVVLVFWSHYYMQCRHAIKRWGWQHCALVAARELRW